LIVDNNHLGDKPKASAQNLYSYLSLLPDKVAMTGSQHKALNRDLEKIEYLILKLNETTSREQWRELLSMFRDMSRSIGGCVGDEAGQKWNQFGDSLWNDILAAYSGAE